MKADARRIRAALAAPSGIRLFLLHGPDVAGSNDLALLLARSMGADAERIDLDGAMLAKDPARLADEAASLSLFGGARFVRVSAAGDESVAAIELLLAAERDGSPVLVIAPAVRTTSKLVKLAIAAPQALTYASYEPSPQEAERIAAGLARDAGLLAQPGVARRLASAAGGDRALIAREVEKLALYLDAAPEMPQPLDHAALDAVGADLGDSEATRLVAAAVEGRSTDLGAELAALGAGGVSPVPWLRALGRRLLALAEIRAEIDAGRPLEAAMKRLRIRRDEEAVAAQLARRWSALQLAEALSRTVVTEREVTRTGTAGSVVAEQTALALSRAAARL